MTDDVVKRLNNAFVVVSEPVGVVVDYSHPESPAFRCKELSVHCLVLVFVFPVILLLDLSGLSFNLSVLSLSTHQMIWEGKGSKSGSYKKYRGQSPKSRI